MAFLVQIMDFLRLKTKALFCFFEFIIFIYVYILFLELSLDELESYGKEWDRHDQYGYFLPIQKKSDVFKDPKFVLINDFLNRKLNDETFVVLIFSFCNLYVLCLVSIPKLSRQYQHNILNVMAALIVGFLIYLQC